MKKRPSGNHLLTVSHLSVSLLFVTHVFKLIKNKQKNYAASNLENYSLYIIFLFYTRLFKKSEMEFSISYHMFTSKTDEARIELELCKLDLLKNRRPSPQPNLIRTWLHPLTARSADSLKIR